MKTAIPGGVCALAFVFAALGVPAQEQTGNDIVIRHVRVFDGESVINNTSVLITNGKVAAMVASLSTPPARSHIDGRDWACLSSREGVALASTIRHCAW
jgi:hypothetical protein